MPDDKDFEPNGVDFMIYHDMHFLTDYIADGIREEEVNAMLRLFKGKRVKVHIEITEV